MLDGGAPPGGRRRNGRAVPRRRARPRRAASPSSIPAPTRSTSTRRCGTPAITATPAPPTCCSPPAPTPASPGGTTPTPLAAARRQRRRRARRARRASRGRSTTQRGVEYARLGPSAATPPGTVSSSSHSGSIATAPVGPGRGRLMSISISSLQKGLVGDEVLFQARPGDEPPGEPPCRVSRGERRDVDGRPRARVPMGEGGVVGPSLWRVKAACGSTTHDAGGRSWRPAEGSRADSTAVRPRMLVACHAQQRLPVPPVPRPPRARGGGGRRRARVGCVLDRSALHPGGGGQVSDTGWVEHAGGVVAIAGVETVDGVVWHVLAEPVGSSGAVVVRVDATRRARVAQLHTDSHILNAIVFERFPGTLVTGAQINDDGTGRMDFDLSEVDNDVLRSLDAAVNEMIRREVEVRSTYVDAGGRRHRRAGAQPVGRPAADARWSTADHRDRRRRPPGLRRHAPVEHRAVGARSGSPRWRARASATGGSASPSSDVSDCDSSDRLTERGGPSVCPLVSLEDNPPAARRVRRGARPRRPRRPRRGRRRRRRARHAGRRRPGAAAARRHLPHRLDLQADRRRAGDGAGRRRRAAPRRPGRHLPARARRPAGADARSARRSTTPCRRSGRSPSRTCSRSGFGFGTSTTSTGRSGAADPAGRARARPGARSARRGRRRRSTTTSGSAASPRCR